MWDQVITWYDKQLSIAPYQITHDLCVWCFCMGVRGPGLGLEGSAADDPGGAALNSSEQQDQSQKPGQ